MELDSEAKAAEERSKGSGIASVLTKDHASRKKMTRQSEPPPLSSNEPSFKKSSDAPSFTKRLMRRSGSSGASSAFRPKSQSKSRSPLSLRPEDAPYDLGHLGSIGSQRCSSSVQDHHLQVDYIFLRSFLALISSQYL